MNGIVLSPTPNTPQHAPLPDPDDKYVGFKVAYRAKDDDWLWNCRTAGVPMVFAFREDAEADAARSAKKYSEFEYQVVAGPPFILPSGDQPNASP